ncbi:hypothetical protein PTKIN_Ptkin08bG0115800 [Pterospermum kingtungense]
MICRLFNSDDAKFILSLPLCNMNAPDKIVWHHTRNREYTIKSGYHFLRSLRLDKSAQGSRDNIAGHEVKRRVWGSIWKTKLPLKVKIFAWRLCREILHVYASLKNRKIPVSDDCPRCRKAMETTLHAVRDCCFASEV